MLNQPIAHASLPLSIVPITIPSAEKNKEERDVFVKSKFKFIKSNRSSSNPLHGGLTMPHCFPTLINVGCIGVDRYCYEPTEPAAICFDRRVDGDEMGNIKNTSRITSPKHAWMNWLVLCCAVCLLMCFSLADAEPTFCTGTKCQTTKQKQDMAMAMTSSSSIPRRLLLSKRLLPSTSTNFVYMKQNLNTDEIYGCCGDTRTPGYKKVTALRDCQRGMFELSGNKLYANEITEPPKKSDSLVPRAPGCGMPNSGSIYLNSGTGFCGGTTWVGGFVGDSTVTDNQICYNGPDCTHTDGVTANTVECMCGQSICTAEEKYCGYTPSGAIGTFGTVGQCGGFFSVLNSGKCYDPGSDRWVIKDLADCNLGSTRVDLPCQGANNCDTAASSASYNGLPTGCVAQSHGSLLYLQEDSNSANCASYFYCICWHGPECSNTLGTESIDITPCMCGGKICRGGDSSTMYCIKETMQCSLTPRQCLYTSGKTGNTGACTCGTGVPPVICGQVNRYCIRNLNFCGPQCNAGTYRNLINGACDSCSAGLYNTETDQSDVSACVPCSAGTYSFAVGASLESTCQNCPTGTATTITATSVITATLT